MHKNSGYIYLLKVTGGPCKIGMTTKPFQRFNTLYHQSGMPIDYICCYLLRYGNVRRVEIHWHKRFAEKRIAGEWFDLSDEDINEFTNCARYSGPDYEPYYQEEFND